MVAVGAPNSQLQEVAERARAPFVPVPRRAPARASLWALTIPVLLAARALGLVRVTEADLAETAARLDADAERCRPSAESFVNPAKSLALNLAGSIPIVWGSSPLATVAITIELVGVLAVGILSLAMPDAFPSTSVWSGFGSGYGFVPLVLPVVGLWWLHRTRDPDLAG